MRHVFKLGPIETGEGDLVLYITCSETGGAVSSDLARSDGAALQQIVSAARGDEVVCSPELARAARKLGLAVAELPDWALEMRAMLAWGMAHGGRIAPADSAGLEDLIGGMCQFLDAAPWEYLEPDVPYVVEATGALRHTYEAAVMGAFGEEFGVLLYERPGSLARTIALADEGRRDEAAKMDLLSVSSSPDPEFAVRALEAAYGVEGMPEVMALRGGHPRPVKSAEIALVTAALEAFAKMGADDREARAEVRGVRVAVRGPADGAARVPTADSPVRAKCHLREDEVARAGGAESIAPALQLDRQLVPRILEYAERRLGLGTLKQAFGDCPIEPRENGTHAMLLVPWVVYERRQAGKTLAERYLEEEGLLLPPVERRWIEAQSRTRVSIWEITAVEPGRVSMRDLISGAERVVLDQGLSQSGHARDTILARVVDFDESSVAAGVHPYSLTPAQAARVLEGVRGKRVADLGRRLMARWEIVEQEASRQPPPTLANTDGEPLLMTTDLYAIADDAAAEVEARMQELCEDEPEREGGETRFTITRPGNRMHASWNNTILGTVRIRGRSLRIESNSVARADALRARVERSCGGLLTHRARSHEDPTARMGEPGAKRHAREAPPPPEVVEALREMIRQQEAAWLDQSIPALGGKTPRQAARAKKSRAALDLLLRDMECTQARFGSELQMDVKAIRAALGLA